jgi:hypothetical protein
MSKALGNEIAYAIARIAEAQGAHGAHESIGHGADDYCDDGGGYKVVWVGEHGIFTVYSDGEWDWETEQAGISGRTMPPHSRAWLRKLFKAGVYDQIAISAIFEWRALKEESSRAQHR